jgi:hypothetical protein
LYHRKRSALVSEIPIFFNKRHVISTMKARLVTLSLISTLLVWQTATGSVAEDQDIANLVSDTAGDVDGRPHQLMSTLFGQNSAINDEAAAAEAAEEDAEKQSLSFIDDDAESSFSRALRRQYRARYRGDLGKRTSNAEQQLLAPLLIQDKRKMRLRGDLGKRRSGFRGDLGR